MARAFRALEIAVLAVAFLAVAFVVVFPSLARSDEIPPPGCGEHQTWADALAVIRSEDSAWGVTRDIPRDKLRNMFEQLTGDAVQAAEVAQATRMMALSLPSPNYPPPRAYLGLIDAGYCVLAVVYFMPPTDIFAYLDPGDLPLPSRE